MTDQQDGQTLKFPDFASETTSPTNNKPRRLGRAVIAAIGVLWGLTPQTTVINTAPQLSVTATATDTAKGLAYDQIWDALKPETGRLTAEQTKRLADNALSEVVEQISLDDGTLISTPHGITAGKEYDLPPTNFVDKVSPLQNVFSAHNYDIVVD